MKHGLHMLIGCGLSLLAIFLLPALGVSMGWTLAIFFILMIGCHLFMAHGGHDEEENHEQDKKSH